MAATKFNQRTEEVLEWVLPLPESANETPDLRKVWHEDRYEPEEIAHPMLAGEAAVSNRRTDSAVDPRGRYEMFYLKADHVVWLVHAAYIPSHDMRIKGAMRQGKTVRQAMLSIYGDPVAERLCPDTQEALVNWARMVVALQPTP